MRATAEFIERDRRDARGHFREHCIADRISQMFVDAPEAVQVDHGNRRSAAPSASRQARPKAAAEGGPIHEPGQRIFVGQPANGVIARLHRRLHEMQALGEHAEFVAALHARRARRRCPARIRSTARVRSCSGRVMLRASQNAANAEATRLTAAITVQHLGEPFEGRARVRQRARQNRDHLGVADFDISMRRVTTSDGASAFQRQRAHDISPAGRLN